MKAFLSLAAVLMFVSVSWADAPKEEGFVSLFDGKTLNGWKVGANADMFKVVDGMIVMECPATTHEPAHLFYVGDVAKHDFKNFDLKVDVKTFRGANSGIYFHTKYQEAGWPNFGMECQVNNSHSDWRRTGSLYAWKNLTWGPEKPEKDNKQEVTVFPEPPVTDGVWYTQEVIYQNGKTTVKLNDKTVLECSVPNPDTPSKLVSHMTWSPRGTFALQGHPPMPNGISKACYKNIRVKVLPD